VLVSAIDVIVVAKTRDIVAKTRDIISSGVLKPGKTAVAFLAHPQSAEKTSVVFLIDNFYHQL
jgi:hypothetical protein